MIGVSYQARNAIDESSAVSIRVTAHTAVQGIGEVPVTGGSVTFDSTQNVRRQATVNFPNDPALWPDNPFSILSPFGTELEVEYGLVLPGGSIEYCPLMIGPITTTPWVIGDTGEIQVKIADYCSYLSDDRFDVATSTTNTTTVVSQITTWINQTLPNVVVTDLTGDTTMCSIVDVQQDRLAAVVKLAEAIGAEVYCDRVGGFVIDYQATLADTPVFHLRGSTHIVKASRSIDRSGVYNRVRVSGQSNTTTTSGSTTTSQTPPVYAVAQDDDTTSPTYYGGPFGRKTRFYVSSFITTTAQAQTTASSLLAKVRGGGISTGYTTITDPTLDAGDVGYATVRGSDTTAIIDSVTVPFTVTDTQDIKSRAAALPDESSST